LLQRDGTLIGSLGGGFRLIFRQWLGKWGPAPLYWF
jgi:hypothetical protein